MIRVKYTVNNRFLKKYLKISSFIIVNHYDVWFYLLFLFSETT